MKRLLLIIAVVVSFFVGYGMSAKAYPSPWPFGRGEYHGYFTDAYDTSGWEVLNQYCSGAYNYYNGSGYCNSIPNYVNSASSFIAFIQDRINNGAPGGTFGDPRAKTGADFIVQTMTNGSRNRPPAPNEWNDWVNLINQYAAAGLIEWNTSAYTFNLNTFFQGTDNNPSPLDDAFYDDVVGGAAIVFHKPGGGVAYALRRACANPVGQGNLGPLPPLANFSISGRSTVSSPTVKPNTPITFQHYVKNNGPTDTAGTNIWWVAESMPSGAAVGGPANSGTYAAGQEKNVFNHTFTVPINAVVGSQICERVGWDPVNSGGARNGRGAPVCATVIPDFNLTPVVIASATNGAEGDQITFTYQVTSSGVTASSSVACTPVGNTRAPGWVPLPQQDNVARSSDAGYAPPATNCPRVFQPNTPTQVATETITLGSLTPGTRVCRSLVVNPYTYGAGPRTSAETCVIIAKTPYARFMGNDVWAGGGFAAVNPTCNTSAKITTVGRTLTSGAKAGSVTEYNAFALDQITSFGSAGRVLNGSGAIGDVSRMLTFANSEPVASKLGYFGAASHCINDHIANYSAAPAIAAGAYAVDGRGSGAWRVTGNLTIHGTMPAGGQQVYYATGDVTIDSNLVYPAAYAGYTSIPSLVILTTGNIFVSPNVSQMDGIFVARGNGVANGVFYTCYPKNEPASVTHPCNANQLVVNGSVAAARLDLFRSFGATGATDPLRQAPGELFQFNYELYLRNVLNASATPTIETMNTLDLPTRF